jgi:hypothetical protein
MQTAMQGGSELPVAWFLHQLDDRSGPSIGGSPGRSEPERAITYRGPRFEKRGDANEHAGGPLTPRSLDRDPAGVEPRRAVLLVGSMMLFVDNEQP